MTNEGQTEQQAKAALAASIQKKIDKAIAQGASPEGVQKFVAEQYNADLFNEGHQFTFETSEPQEAYTFPEEDLSGWEEPTYIPVATDPSQYSEETNERLIAAKENLITSYQFMMEELASGFQDEATQVRFNRMRKTNNYAVKDQWLLEYT